MALLQWSENLSVGVVEMDRQHQKLVELVNRLYQAMGEGKGDNLKKEILTELLTYTKIHFSAEERLMREHGYPQLADHKRLHDQLMDKVIQMNDKIRSGRMVPSVSLGTFLKDWLLTHILQQDKKYGAFVHVPVS